MIADDGSCQCRLITVITDDVQVARAATNGNVMMHGLHVLTEALLPGSHNAHIKFHKWSVKPATAQFFLTPSEELPYTIQHLANTIHEPLAKAVTEAANKDRPNNNTIHCHSTSPMIKLVTSDLLHNYQY